MQHATNKRTHATGYHATNNRHHATENREMRHTTVSMQRTARLGLKARLRGQQCSVACRRAFVELLAVPVDLLHLERVLEELWLRHHLGCSTAQPCPHDTTRCTPCNVFGCSIAPALFRRGRCGVHGMHLGCSLYHARLRGSRRMSHLDWTGLDWIELDWAGLGWARVELAGLDWTGLELTGLEVGGADGTEGMAGRVRY